MTTEKSEFADDYQALHAASIRLAARMLASLDDAATANVEHAVRHGARMMVQLGPLPDCHAVELVLVEREGNRVPLARIGVAS